MEYTEHDAAVQAYMKLYVSATGTPHVDEIVSTILEAAEKHRAGE